MDFSPAPEVGALTAEVREFLAAHLTDDMRREMHRTGTSHDWGLHRAIAERGWM